MNPLNAKLNPICHLLALLGAHHIFHVSRIRVNILQDIVKTVRDKNEDTGCRGEMKMFFNFSI